MLHILVWGKLHEMKIIKFGVCHIKGKYDKLSLTDASSIIYVYLRESVSIQIHGSHSKLIQKTISDKGLN